MRFFKSIDYENKKVLEEVNRKCLHKLISARENGDYHHAYREEQRYFNAIKCGNMELVHTLVKKPYLNDYAKNRYETNRNIKNFYIVVVAIAARAAIEGGVPKDIAFALNETYTELIEESSTENELFFIQQFSMIDFTQKVIYYQNRKYSQSVNQCIHYIERHIHKKITIDHLVKITGLSSRQLARKFRKELSSSIVEYIQHEKVKEAKKFLEFSEYSILEIGYILDFCSQSYFISTFKKYEGITPAQYRDGSKRIITFLK